MRANIGFLLIGLGLVGAYIALGGKFARAISPNNALANGSEGLATTFVMNGQSGVPSTNQAFSNNPVPVTGGASQPANVPNIGSGGESLQSKWTQLGHIVSIQPMDRHASHGGMR